jgi:hypothetical protein
MGRRNSLSAAADTTVCEQAASPALQVMYADLRAGVAITSSATLPAALKKLVYVLVSMPRAAAMLSKPYSSPCPLDQSAGACATPSAS